MDNQTCDWWVARLDEKVAIHGADLTARCSDPIAFMRDCGLRP